MRLLLVSLAARGDVERKTNAKMHFVTLADLAPTKS